MDRYRWSSLYLPGFNTAARMGLRMKAMKDRQIVARACQGKEQEIDRWFDERKLFFGFSSIRGGTVFLTNMLKQEVPDSHIEHEASVIDYWELPKARLSEEDALAYIQGFRRNEIYYRAPHDVAIYGEINPFLRRHCKAVKAVFPNAKLFHLVRDPRDVVRSIMSREILSKKDPMGKLIKPPPWDPYHEQWDSMSRFERVCWEWQDDNRYIREHVSHVVKFEDVTGDYEAFRFGLLDYLGISLSEEKWRDYVSEPRNVSRKNRLEHWTEWPAEKIEILMRICGSEMSEYGYQV